jgi:hypothetical protein
MTVHPRLAPAADTLADFVGRHRGESLVVCGCGASLRDVPERPACVTIGVNDVGRRFDPDYLVVVNPPSQFAQERRRAIVESRARAVFTQYSDWRLQQAPCVPIALGAYGGVDFANPSVLHFTRNSPYVAVCLAIQVGAARVGLIGVDFTEGHFFGATGVHSLAGCLKQIDAEYARLSAAAAARGVEIVNLSAVSRLTSLPRADLTAFLQAAPAVPRPPPALHVVPAAPAFRTPPAVAANAVGGDPAQPLEARAGVPAPSRKPRVFFVHYRFLACGEVFTDGLRHAAEDLGLPAGHAHWDDPRLAEKVASFAPDLLWVVHGRNFVKRWGGRFGQYRSAVWLLDEPYEVDDTAAFSSQFSTVFLNDPATLDRHRNSHYLPTCYDPRVHLSAGGPRQRRVGFVGGGNATRERFLGALAERGLLSYLVGGPWRDPRLQALCLAPNVPASATTDLYRDTDIVLNVFRDLHHFNRAGVQPTSMNPRIYEALACGALVVSEERPEIAQRLPALPTFATIDRAVELVERFLADPSERERVRAESFEGIRSATYAGCLQAGLEIALGANPTLVAAGGPMTPKPTARSAPAKNPDPAPESRMFDDDWDDFASVSSRGEGGVVLIEPGCGRGPGAERGLASRKRFDAVALSFEVSIGAGACFLAKVCQQDRLDQTTNSYHLLCDERQAYVARHNQVLRRVSLARGEWRRVELSFLDGALSLRVGDEPPHRISDRTLSSGYAFLGAQGGPVRLRSIGLTALERPAAAARSGDFEVLEPVAAPGPRVSIVTTVYDRTDCLRHCIKSVQNLTFRDYEHIVVSDSPPTEVVSRIREMVRATSDERIGYFNLSRRHNNWGIAPANAGLRQARGEYVCFLSDDNAYLPDHLDNLIRALDQDLDIGFAYSSCQYDGRRQLRHPVPQAGCIDLGQPLFRRSLFRRHLNDALPFNVFSWDWRLIEMLMAHGVRWEHVDQPSFIFRLSKYPEYLPALSAS